MIENPAPDARPTSLDLDAGVHLWCTCGRSGHLPFCDGSHKGSGCFPIKFTLDHPRAACLCGLTGGGLPFCDGTHAQRPTTGS